MRPKFTKGTLRRPSPALVISVIALIVAIGGGTFAIAALSKKTVNKIANRDANNVFSSRIGGASVANAANTPHSTNADHASNSDLLGGSPPSAFQSSVKKLLVDTTGVTVPEIPLATVGPFSISGLCHLSSTGGGNEASSWLSVTGPANTGANGFYVQSTPDDSAAATVHTIGVLFTGESVLFSATSPATDTQLERDAGTVMLSAGTTLAEVNFNFFAQRKDASTPHCFFSGTAFLAS